MNMACGKPSIKKSTSPQIEVPVMVWISPEYALMNPEVVEKIKTIKDKSIMTSEVSCLALKVAGINDDCVSPIDSLYDFNKPRMVMNSIDYNKK